MNDDGTYAVCYADGDFDRACPASSLEARSDAGPEAWKVRHSCHYVMFLLGISDLTYFHDITRYMSENSFDNSPFGSNSSYLVVIFVFFCSLVRSFFQCEDCGSSNVPFLKSCRTPDATGVCGNPNPRYPARPAFSFAGFTPFRREKPTKIDVYSLPSWDQYYADKIEPKKKEILVKRHELIKGDFKVDDTLNKKIVIWNGDITALEADAIVNAANEGLYAGGGICGAIHSAAGPKLEEECRRHGPCPTGFTALTNGYELYAKYVLHSVGPTNGDPAALISCYNTCLEVSKKKGLKNLVFCCISTGIFGFPNGPAAIYALSAVRQWLEASKENADAFDRIVFCTFTQEDRILYDQLTPIMFPVTSENVQPEEKKGEEPKAEEPAEPTFNVGDRVLCIDTENMPLPAVLEKFEDGKFFVHYINYSRRWDEWIEAGSPRINAYRERAGPVFKLEPFFSS